MVNGIRRKNMNLQLVKDFKKFKFIYYWVDRYSMKVSPDMATFYHAEEWITDYRFSLYKGIERRVSKIDRRKARLLRVIKGKARFSAKRGGVTGRRVTDNPVTVDLNLAVEKLNVLKRVMEVEMRQLL